MSKGWYNERRRHSLASKGVSTTRPRNAVRNANMARFGENNGRWRGGRSKTYYRRIANCERNDGTIVHHKDHNKHNISPDNLERIKPTKKITARGIHNRQHPEKGYRDRPRSFVRWVDKIRNGKNRDWKNWRFSIGDSTRYTYSEIQRLLLSKKPDSVKAYYKGKYYDKIKFRVSS